MDSQIYLELDIKTELGWIKTFYLLTQSSIDIFVNWYDQLNQVILDNGLEISPLNLQYNLIESTDPKFVLADNFIKEFGRPFDLLEQIEELSDLEQQVDLNLDTNSCSSDTDSELYTQTEAIGDIISAHVSGNTDRVIQLLGSTNIDDDEIITNIKKKYL
jgi:hypothetical protein